MKKSILITSVLLALVVASCNSSVKNIFSRAKTPHEKYKDKLEDVGLEKTADGKQWLVASAAALQVPQLISLPYSMAGNFPTDRPRALGLRFTARPGEQLLFSLQKNVTRNFVLYAEIYQQKEDGETKLVEAIDTAATEFTYSITEAGNYILKLQPQLYRSGTYHLAISIGPSIGFPVQGAKASIGSFWGDHRDGGKRSHEGIDIFASKGTPAIAAADGIVVGVKEGGIGGKTVWLRPANQPYTLYYAHLDKQLVQEGQQVRQGEILGLVGNTGNAKHTPAHLHFGVYGNNGPIDPLPFVNRTVKKPAALKDKKWTTYIRMIKERKVGDLIIKKNALLVPVAYNSDGYLAELPDGSRILTPYDWVQPVNETENKTKGIASALVNKSRVS